MKDKIGTWQDVTDILNEELNYEYTESKYRKQFMAFQKIFEANKDKIINNDVYLKEIQKQQDELFKIKRQLADQRREYNKLLIADARAEHLAKELIEIAKQLNEDKSLDFKKNIHNVSDKEAVLIINDIHYGLVTENIWNKYNTEIAKHRLETLVIKVKKYIRLHQIKKLHIILLGDAAHGAIHTSCRVASEEETCDQLMHISEIIAEVVAELANEVEETDVNSTYGNHLRSIQDKDDSIHSDNMEKLIPWWLKQRFQNRDDIHIIDSEYYEFIKLNVLGYNIAAVHGDLDRIKDFGLLINTIFSKRYDTTIDYAILADKHHIEEFEQLGIESILVRSLCGVDEYANKHRKYSGAGQTFIVFNNEDGRECTYHIKLD